MAKKEVIKSVTTRQLDSLSDKLDNLQVQPIIMQALQIKALPGRELEAWGKHISLITPSVANFARKALVRCLSTNNNLFCWGKSTTDSCPLCKTLETENHVLNNLFYCCLCKGYTLGDTTLS